MAHAEKHALVVAPVVEDPLQNVSIIIRLSLSLLLLSLSDYGDYDNYNDDDDYHNYDNYDNYDHHNIPK